MSNISSIQSSGQLLQGFLKAASGDGAVELKGGEVRQTPAKLGFFARVVQWFKGESSAKLNEQTRASFHEALNKAFGRDIAKDALASYRLEGENKDKPLMSRDVRAILERATSEWNMDKMGLNFQSKNNPIIRFQGEVESVGRENEAVATSELLGAEGKNEKINKQREELKEANAGISRSDVRSAEKSGEHLRVAMDLRKELNSINAADAEWVDVKTPEK